LQLSSDLNEKKALAGFEPMQERQAGPVAYYTNHDFLVGVVSKRTVLVGTMGMFGTVAVTKEGQLAKHPLSAALQEAASGKKTILAAGNLTLLPPQALNDVPPPIRPLMEAQTAMLAVTLGKTSLIEATLTYRDKDSANDAAKSIDALKELARAGLGKLQGEAKAKLKNAPAASLFDIEKSFETIGPVVALGSVKQFEEMLDKLPIGREGDSLTAKVPIPEEFQSVALVTVPVLVALLVPAVQKVREAASRTQDMNNLKMMGLAMHSHHDVYKQFPAPSWGRTGKGKLSWRVAILPFVEEARLYNEFKHDEPWDSEHNKKLIPRMPKLFEIPNVAAPEGMTHYQVIVGGKDTTPSLYADPFERVRITDITDGSSNTLMIVQGEKAVPWTKPDDVTFDPKANNSPRLYRHPYGYVVLLCDGSVRILPPTISAERLKAIVTRSGGETIGPSD